MQGVGASLLVGPRSRITLHNAAALAPSSWIIDIDSPEGGENEAARAGQRLRLRFNDIVEPRDDLRLPSVAAIQALLDFASDWPNRAAAVAFCFAGISRSPAAAFILACARSAPGVEFDLARDLRAAAPSATPNALMIALADQLLRRDGRMSAAIAALGRGAQATYGEIFRVDFTASGPQIRAAAAKMTAASPICSTAPNTSPV